MTGKSSLRLRGHGRTVLTVGLCMLLIISLGFNLYQAKRNPAAPSATVQQAQYSFLSKRVALDNPNDVLINFVSLRKSLESQLAQVSANKSFYFEYLPGGTSIQIGSDNELVAASLIKVPLAMNLYRAAELGRIDLDKQVAIQQADLDDGYGNLWQKGAGYQLTLRDAVKFMLQDSDNTAMHMIFNAVNGLLKDDEQSLSQLDVEQIMHDGRAVITAESYGSVLRSLYLSSYLSKDNSQELLQILAGSKETRRLTANLPKEVPVAHKNGVFNAAWSESDCGIVYVPKRPYILCIMLGLPEDQSNALIAKLSKEIYDYVVSQP